MKYCNESKNLVRESCTKETVHDPIRIANTLKEQEEVYQLRAKAYKDIYPGFTMPKHESYDSQGVTFYSRNKENKVVSTIRLTQDNEFGLPSEEYYSGAIEKYRQAGYQLLEFGRMINLSGDIKVLKKYHRVVYDIAKKMKIDFIIMALKQKDVAFYQHLVGVEILVDNLGIPHGGKDKMSGVAWNLNDTKPYFFKWTNSK